MLYLKKNKYLILAIALILLISAFCYVETDIAYAQEDDLLLSSLEVKGFKFDEDFSPTQYKYTVKVPKGTKAVTILAVPKNPEAKVKLPNSSLLETGGNELDVIVEFGGNKKIYTINVQVSSSGISNNSYLNNLDCGFEGMTPKFDSKIFDYAITVPNNITKLNILPDKGHKGQIIEIQEKPFEVGSNNIVKVVVTAENGVNKSTYTITVTRLESREASKNCLISSLSPKNKEFKLNEEFNKGVFNYTTNVYYYTKEIEFNVILDDPNAQYIITGNDDLQMGKNTIVIKVIAEDGKTTQDYIVEVDRPIGNNNNYLKSLSVEGYKISPAFQKDVYDYNVKIKIDDRSVNVKYETDDPNATVLVQGDVNLIGSKVNDVTITVTAQNMDKRVYTIHVLNSKTPDYENEDTGNITAPKDKTTSIPGGFIFGIPKWALGVILGVLILVLIVLIRVIDVFVKRKYKVKSFNIKEYNAQEKGEKTSKNKKKIKDNDKDNQEEQVEVKPTEEDDGKDESTSDEEEK